jgi:hypothetical protein
MPLEIQSSVFASGALGAAAATGTSGGNSSQMTADTQLTVLSAEFAPESEGVLSTADMYVDNATTAELVSLLLEVMKVRLVERQCPTLLLRLRLPPPLRR